MSRFGLAVGRYIIQYRPVIKRTMSVRFSASAVLAFSSEVVICGRCLNCDLIIIIIMYIYHALINALSAHMIYINLNMILYTQVEHSPTKAVYIKY